MKKGFTLMEILFVVMFVALLITLAAPSFRAVRFDIKNARAQTALKKLVEARLSFYQYTRGADIKTTGGNQHSSFQGTDAKNLATPTDLLKCTDFAASGVPSSSTPQSEDIRQLFLCKFLDWRDFQGLPYEFHNCDPKNANPSAPCVKGAYAVARGVSRSQVGQKYDPEDGYYMYIGADRKVKEEYGVYEGS